MIKREELSNPDSCINRAEDHEPVFVLRANDPVAAQVVMYWCELARIYHELEKIREASALAQEMDDYHMKLVESRGGRRP